MSDVQKHSELQVLADTVAVSLDKLQHGHCGTVEAINCDQTDIHRLAGMGVCVGRQVELERCGDPMILRAVGTRIGISGRLGKRIYVQRCSYSCEESHGP